MSDFRGIVNLIGFKHGMLLCGLFLYGQIACNGIMCTNEMSILWKYVFILIIC
jgi:hypothetical protein